MEYLYRFNEKFGAFDDKYQIGLIKDIILELKHKYPSLEGSIDLDNSEFNHLNPPEGSYLTVITLENMAIYNEHRAGLVNLDKKLKYTSDIIEVAKRLQDATEREVVVIGLFIDNIKTGVKVKIIIDDPINKIFK